MADNTRNIIRGRYQTIREISRGGMGVVFLAKDLLKNKDVAVKKSFFSGAKQAERAFEIEAKLLARLEHPGLPKVLDYFYGESNVQTLVMDFIVGETLEDVLESGKFRVGRGLDSVKVTDWAIQILDILRYLHNFEPPVVHRDIKPNNIKITAEGKIILLDFGLAKGSAVTVVGGMSGYSPIEQVQHTGTDPRSDIYALGTSLFHLLTDQYPYTAVDRFQEIYGHALGINPEINKSNSPKTDPQMTVAEINPQVPEAISEIVMKAMALMSNDRFQSVEEMKSALLKARRKLDASTTREVMNSISGKTNIDLVNDWEKAPPLILENEEIIGHWDQQDNEADPTGEKSDSFVSFVPQKINNVEFENEPTEIEIEDLSETVSSTSLFGKKVESQITKPSAAANQSSNVFFPNTKFTGEIKDFEKTAPSRKNKKRIIPFSLAGIALIFLTFLGILAWYFLAGNSSGSNRILTQSTAETTASSKEPEERPKKVFKAVTYQVEKNGEKKLFDENHRFADNEEFKIGVTTSQEGFLYIVSRDDQSKAVFPYPKPNQNDNFINKDAEMIFPQDQNFTLSNDTWVYFIVVSSRDDSLVKRISKTLNNKMEKSLALNEVKELFTDLDKLAVDEAEINSIIDDSGNKPLVKIVKLRKKT